MSLAILIVYIVFLGFIIFVGVKLFKKLWGMTLGDIIKLKLKAGLVLFVILLVIMLLATFLSKQQ